MTDSSFFALCAKVRASILRTYGAGAVPPFLAIIDLLEILARDTLPVERLIDKKDDVDSPT